MKIVYLLLLLAAPLFSLGQGIGIGTTTPNGSAMLDVSSSNKGILPPRLTTQQRLNNIESPAAGLVVYDTDLKSLYFYDGSDWIAMGAGSKKRSVYIPGGALTFSSANVTRVALGLSLADNAGIVSFIIPRPVDWDSTKPFTVFLNFSLPSNTLNTFITWRLLAGSTNINSVSGNANSGWDSYNFTQSEDAALLVAPASPSYSELAKQQSWTPKFSNTFNTFYFGTGVTTNNDFSNDPMWRFSFQRGRAASNGETYSGNIIVNGVTIEYTPK